MEKIKCPECKKKLSAKAVMCPKCGCPLSDMQKSKDTTVEAILDEYNNEKTKINKNR